MKKLMCNLGIGILAFGMAISPAVGQSKAERKADRKNLDAQAKTVNNLVRHDDDVRRSMALERISTETGVPIERVRAMNKEYSKTGVAGLLLGAVLANETKKDPEQFLKQHANGKEWAAIARENNVPVERLTERLDRFETAIRPTESGTYKITPGEQK